jgi:hypothetical protein
MDRLRWGLRAGKTIPMSCKSSRRPRRSARRRLQANQGPQEHGAIDATQDVAAGRLPHPRWRCSTSRGAGRCCLQALCTVMTPTRGVKAHASQPRRLVWPRPVHRLSSS